MKRILINLSVIAAVAAIVVGGTMAWFRDTGTSTDNTFISGTLDLQLSNDGNTYSDNVTGTWGQDNMEPGGTPSEFTLHMKNVGSIDSDHMSLAVVNTPSGISGTTNDQYYLNRLDDHMRITELKYAGKSLLTGGAGADLSNYVAPTDCDVTVDPSVADYDTIQEGINAADTGNVVCVKPGNYQVGWQDTAFPILVNRSITLVSLEGPATTTITAPANKNAIEIGADNVTVKGFTITGAAMAIYTEGHSGIIIRDNRIVGYNVEGVKINGGDITITNNVIQAKVNPSTSADSIYTKGGAAAIVSYNDLENNHWSGNVQTGVSDPNAWSTAAGIAVHEGDNVTAKYNNIDNNDFGIQVKGKETAGAASPTVIANYNNIYGNNLSDFFYEKIVEDTTTPFNATSNWWGADTLTLGANVGAGDTTGFIDVDSYIDYTPYAGGPFIGYINGVDGDGNGGGNSNHFADLADFQAQGIDNIKPGLAAKDKEGDYHTLKMAVQLDGPTTDSNYQGGKLKMDMTVNMYQSSNQ